MLAQLFLPLTFVALAVSPLVVIAGIRSVMQHDRRRADAERKYRAALG